MNDVYYLKWGKIVNSNGMICSNSNNKHSKETNASKKNKGMPFSYELFILILRSKF